MQLRTLTLQAIGPFAGRYTVDFAELGASGIFLLEGPTGAGKSTLIDAVVFALYGKVASAAASEDRLRSGHAAADVPSFVDLVFETGAGVFRVRRTPAYDRPKKRGTGSAREQSTVTLWRLPADVGPDPEGAGEVVATRLDEAGAELQRIVGLDRTQFVQTVVLPQGEFASFLRANPEDRRGLLQKIFGTEVYERVQQRLEELRREAQRATGDARATLTSAAAHLVGAIGLEGEDAAALLSAAEDGGTGTVTLASAHVARLRDAAMAADDGLRAAEAACAEAAVALDLATATAAALERRTVLRRERAELEARAAKHTADVLRRDRARRAVTVRPLVAGWDAATTEVAATRKALAAAVDAAPTDLIPADAAWSSTSEGRASARTALVAARDEATAVGATLVRAVGLEQGLPVRRRQLADLRAALTAADTEHARLADVLAVRPAERQRWVELLDVARNLATQHGTRLAAREAAVHVLEAARQVVALGAAVADAERLRDEARTVAAAAVEREADLRRARIAGMAGEIASGLVDGDPCPVCGGTDHPAPATPATDHVTPEQVEAAEAARKVAEEALAAAAQQVTVLVERRAAAAGAADGATVAEAERLLADADTRLTEAVAAVSERDRIGTELDAFDTRTRELTAELSDLGTQTAAARAGLEAFETALAADVDEVTQARGELPTVAARRSAVQARVDAADTVLETLDQLARAEADHAARTTELAAGLVEHGFTDAADARDARLPADEAERLERRVDDHAAAVRRVEEGLAEPAVVALPEDVTVDLDGARAAHAARSAAVAEAAGTARVAAARAEAGVAAGERLDRASAAVGAAGEAAAPVTRMAGLAAGTGGDNARSLTLATYVLLRRFQDVVAAANDRLCTMSDGRYELMSSDEKEDVRSRRTGLSMRVVDHTTGAARDPRTLSGGETFYVSLCLALGLADVVTAEAGGIDLGTLFVDEGFGSLDPSTLDAVLVELGRLRSGGRVVGVVSHVEALKQTIGDRVEVHRLPDGSSGLRVHAGC